MRLVLRPEILVAFQNNFGVSISQTRVRNAMCCVVCWDIANNTFSPAQEASWFQQCSRARYPRYQSQTYFVSIQEVKVLVDIWNMYSAPWWLTREADATKTSEPHLQILTTDLFQTKFKSRFISFELGLQIAGWIKERFIMRIVLSCAHVDPTLK